MPSVNSRRATGRLPGWLGHRREPRSRLAILLAMLALCLRLVPAPDHPWPVDRAAARGDTAALFDEHALCLAAPAPDPVPDPASDRAPDPPPRETPAHHHDNTACCLWHAGAGAPPPPLGALLPVAVTAEPAVAAVAQEFLVSLPVLRPVGARAPPSETLKTDLA
jgi:hypothetical protein